MNAFAKIDAAEARPHAAFTALEFAKLIENGAFGDLRVELVRGELRKMMPSGFEHGERNVNVAALLSQIYKPLGARIGSDVIIMLSDDTVRAGDVVVVKPGFHGSRVHPEDLLLVVEIADTTLGSDLGDKSIDYAACGIAECWVVDVNGASVHVLTEPGIDGYRQRAVVRFGDPLAVPGTDGSVVID